MNETSGESGFAGSAIETKMKESTEREREIERERERSKTTTPSPTAPAHPPTTVGRRRRARRDGKRKCVTQRVPDANPLQSVHPPPPGLVSSSSLSTSVHPLSSRPFGSVRSNQQFAPLMRYDTLNRKVWTSSQYPPVRYDFVRVTRSISEI